MIELENVSRSFGTFKAVNSISCSIQTGEIIGLLGPNGAGKTTTMRMITGFLEQNSGVIKIDGIDIRQNPKEAKRKIGYMSESAPLYGEMIVADYLEYCAKMQNMDPEIRLPYLAKICGLENVMHKNINELSRGYKQRVGLAHALMNDPEILILDEPTSGLDPNQIIEVRSLIKEIGRTRTVIISTHILGEVEMLCDRVIIISKGKIVADSPTSQLVKGFGSKNAVELKVAKADKDELAEAVKSVKDVDSVQIDSIKDEKLGEILKVTVFPKENCEIRSLVARKILSGRKGWELMELVQRENSLEEVFKSLTNEGDAE